MIPFRDGDGEELIFECSRGSEVEYSVFVLFSCYLVVIEFFSKAEIKTDGFSSKVVCKAKQTRSWGRCCSFISDFHRCGVTEFEANQGHNR